ncbi:hypothetical protein BJ986_001452 [Phycicoccus badiiscoriae]|uniref:Uncharacterized protein n=1 Tax=Pedococcus badiiscoriae TaxID=642776 RepID=A0A852WL89_9MICO|nr:hypothetical protein [Pedococcus badiiscoriae]NYG06965.1 hypothetical protein [Pedococcus badiiscoriae]
MPSHPPSPIRPLTPGPAVAAGPTTDVDDWSSRWADEVDAIADGAMTDGAAAPTRDRGPRVTHLVLVDGLPADHWVEDSSDGRWQPRRRSRASLSLATPDDERERELRWLDALVGGRRALLDLDDRPLVARPLELADLPPETHGRAVAISAECDRLAVEVFGLVELAAALRVLLTAALVADPGMLLRSTRDDTAMGAVVWAGAQANGLIGPTGQLLARDLWPRLGVPPSAAGRGGALLDRLAPGADQLLTPPGAPRLRATGQPGALLGSTRALLVSRRDDLLGGLAP